MTKWNLPKIAVERDPTCIIFLNRDSVDRSAPRD